MNVKVRVLDQLHLSSVSADTLMPGQEIEVSKATAADLEKQGLVTVLDDGAKAEEAPQNKSEEAPINKVGTTGRRSK